MFSSLVFPSGLRVLSVFNVFVGLSGLCCVVDWGNWLFGLRVCGWGYWVLFGVFRCGGCD